MKIIAQGIQLRNIGQLAQTLTPAGNTLMGRLDCVLSDGDKYLITIGGTDIHVKGSHPIDIRRTPALDALVESNWIQEDLADLLEEVVDNAS